MTTILDRIIASKRREVEALAPRAAELRAAAEAAPPARGFGRALVAGSSVALIAEFKRRSPSAGWIRRDAEPARVSRGYAAAGASAISVLTDAEHFGGSLEDLRRVRKAVSVPVLRKDFVVDESQVWEARVAGADAVLLIVRILEGERLRRLLSVVEGVGLDALVEVHGAVELRAALEAGAKMVGINNRDLGTFETDLSVSLGLAASVPSEVVLVAESGIRSCEDVERLGRAGVDAVLVGEALMRSGGEGAGAALLAGRPRARRAGRGVASR